MAEEEQMKDEAMAEEGQQLETLRNFGQAQKRRVAFDLVMPSDKSLAPESKLIFVTRTGGKDKTMHPEVRKFLHFLRLQKVNTGVLIKPMDRIMRNLKKLKTMVHYGYPPFESVKTIIYNLATVKLDNRITRLNRNNVVEQAFGQYNINCVEDVVNEIANVGPHFKDVLTAIRPISVPVVGKKPSKGKKTDGGGAEDHIIQLVGKMKIA